MSDATKLWVRWSWYVMPLILALVWLAARGDIPWPVVQKIGFCWLGFGLGSLVRLW